MPKKSTPKKTDRFAEHVTRSERLASDLLAKEPVIVDRLFYGHRTPRYGADGQKEIYGMN